MNHYPPPPPPPPSFNPNSNPPPPPPPPTIAAALSNLTSTLNLCTTTLQSLPTPTPLTLIPCPYNPNHLLPSSSLFSHYLNCPSPLSIALPLHSSAAAAAPPSFAAATSSDVTISLQNYFSHTNNFFYQNCPCPVTPSVRLSPLLNLPTILHTECANCNNKDLEFSVNLIRFFPSEVWAIRSEIESWGGNCPNVYSSRILRAILRMRDCNLLHLHEWIVANSPRYGVIIDFAMSDHVVLLVRLCLKAIVREAYRLAGISFSDGESKMEENVLSGLSNQSFECPHLVKVVMWLGLQFSLLYGEVNGKFLAVGVLKECIINSALNASVFPMEQKNAQSNESEKVDMKVENDKKDKIESIKDQTVGSSMLSISQVAAAVAALHERSMTEENIKALRNPRPLSGYQRNIEHAYVSKIAEEERRNRPDYRPIIEHDGLLWQRSNNQDPNKLKTREELLAEERDYKRRRMSYRGKKLNRNTIEVMRSIIDEYMEEIKQAGEIIGMSKSKAMEETEPCEENKGQTHDYKKKSNSRHDSEDFSSHRDNWLQNSNQNAKWARPDRDDRSRSRDVKQISSHSRIIEPFGESSSNRSLRIRSESRERNYHKRNREELERNNHKERDEHERTSRKRERYEDKRGYRSKTNGARRERYEDDDDDDGRKDRRRKKADEFDDRYDPSESHDI